MEFVIATHNQNKVKEFQRILSPLGISLVTAELDEVDETGQTLAENAFLKADAACRQTGKPAIADDTGLMVDVLNGAPGIYSARYAGVGHSSEECVQKLLYDLMHVPMQMRGAKFGCCICCVFPNGDRILAQGQCAGRIALEKRGTNGFGYDPIFLCGDKTFAEMTAAEKDAVSHRGKALRLFTEKLKDYGEKNHAFK